MKRDDIIDVLTAVAAGDRRTVGEADVTMWGQVINDGTRITKDEALIAVVAHFRERPGVWLEPGHIVERVFARRRDAIDRAPIPAIEGSHFEGHYPGDVKAAADPAEYPAEWDTDQRVTTYWYAVRMHAMPTTTTGWKALAAQLKSKQDERQQESA